MRSSTGSSALFGAMIVSVFPWASGGPPEASAQQTQPSTLATAPDLDMSSMSIVGFDPETGDLGIALASRFFAVAPVAAHVRAGVGAVATMGGAPYADAETMLDWLEAGATPAEVLERLRERHPEGIGQINIVDALGRSVSTTSRSQARMWRGHRFGENYAAAGNVLAGPEVVEAFARSFEGSEGRSLPLAERLLAALEAADAAGGDARGRMGATLIVKRAGAGYQGVDDLVNLRVDDSRHAVLDLRKLHHRWRDIRGQEPGARTVEQARGRDVQWLQRSLRELGYLTGREPSVFADGEAVGLFDDVTADAVARFKTDRGLGASPSAGLETVQAIRRDLAGGRDRREERR